MQPYILVPPSDQSLASEWVKLGVESFMAGRTPDAERHFRNAISKDPGHASATINLAILCSQVGAQTEALLAAERAALFAPTDPLVLANRSLILFEAERIAEAHETAYQAVSLVDDLPPPGDPLKSVQYTQPRFALAIISASAGYPEKAYAAYQEMLAHDPKQPAAGQNACFMQTLMDVGPAELLGQRKLWYEANKTTIKVWPHGNDRDQDRPLKVGYVSGDFKSHSAAMIFGNVLLSHTGAVVPHFYSTMPTNPETDNLTAKFREAGQWREVANLSDEDFDDLIRKDGIDILVDLSGHTGGTRLPVFTRKPAPIQVSAWGFAHGTGVPEIDYFFADPVAVPENERQHYSERIFDLPCIVTYRPPVEYGLNGVSPLPFRQNGYITFGSFSRFEKLSESYLDTVRRILLAVPDSRMVFKDHAFRRAYSINHVRKALAGIDPARLSFAITTPHPDHQQAYQSVDLYLDTWPHGAGVVAMECLYQGVPIVTRYGPQAAGRTAASVLSAMGREEWIARDADEFVERAVTWAGRPADLDAARKTLRKELVDSPVISGYTAAVEAAYRGMWKEYCSRSHA